MSVVAPVSACGAIVPVAAALLTGDQPGALAALGVLTAIAGVILVSRTRPLPGSRAGRPGTRGGQAGGGDGARVGAGVRAVLRVRGRRNDGSRGEPLWVIAGARASTRW